jgi:hypothetical protein
MGPFGLTYARLVEQGYAVLPIMPGTKKPGLPYGNGNWMDFPGWPTFQSTYVHHKLWAQSTAGIAILTGQRSGDTVALDNDSDDPRIAEALRSVLPDTPVRKKGAKGDTGFYHGPGIRSHSWMIDGRKVVEILGTGRQTVLPPTIHPDTGEPYRWTGTKTLEEVRPEELPRLPDNVIELIDAVLVPFGYVPSPEPHRSGGKRTSCDGLGGDGLGDDYAGCDADDPHRRLNQAALDNLAAWVPALNLYNCRPIRDGFEAVATWRPSSTGRDKRKRKHNLKIKINGIKDFGANQGYTALDLVMAAQECDLETAFAFLNERLGWSGGEPLLNTSLDTSLDISASLAAATASAAPKLEMLGLEPDDADSNGSPNGNPHGNGADHTGAFSGASNGAAGAQAGAQASARVSAGVIPLFKPEPAPSIVPTTPAAPEASSIPPWRSFQESENDSEAGNSESSAGTASTSTQGNDPLLESLTYVPGLLGDIVNWIVAHARLPNRVLALAAALIVIGTLIGRRAMGPTGSATHLYVMNIGPSGSGKDGPRKAIPVSLDAAGAGVHLHLGDIYSQSAMNKLLTKMPLCAVVRDEIAGFLGRLVHPRASAWEQSLLDMLCTLWSNNFDRFDTPMSAQADPLIIQAPAISLFGTAVPRKFWPVLQGSEVAGGLFSRFLVFESYARPDEVLPPPSVVPVALKDDLAELYQFGNPAFEMVHLINSNIRPEPQPLDWGNAEAKGVYQRLSKWVRGEIDNDPSQEEYLRRIAEQAIRLATIRAAGIAGHRGKVDAAGMTWGADLASILVTKAMRQSQDSWPENSRSQAAEKLVRVIVRRGSMTLREIQQYIRSRYNSREITDILAQSVISGAIVKTPTGYAAPPKPNKT